MRFGAALLALACAMLGSAALAQPDDVTPATPAQQANGYAEHIAAIASGVCIDVLSGRIAPPDGASESAFWASYGLQPGMPQAALTALRPWGVDIVAQAILASASMAQGGYVLAIGGRDGRTCRIIVHDMPTEADPTSAVMSALAANGWRELSPPRAIPGVSRRSMLRRIDGQAVLLNSTTPDERGSIAAVFFVALVPANVTFPEGS
jgi:hypothetical protein